MSEAGVSAPAAPNKPRIPPYNPPKQTQIDPYLNVDAGTMSPFEHGEVFVLDDGGETDLVRFVGVSWCCVLGLVGWVI